MTLCRPSPLGPPSPQANVGFPTLAAGLPVHTITEPATLWFVGAHGGAGETTLSQLDDGWQASGHVWPVAPVPELWCPTVLVARTSVNGLRAAQGALTQWAASGTGPSTQLLGLVLIADAPGKLPKALRDLTKLVEGGAPRSWHLPWLEDWRLAKPDALRPHRSVRVLVHHLKSLTATPVPTRAIPHNQAPTSPI